MCKNIRMIWLGILPAVALLLGSSTAAQDADPCKQLEELLKAGWPEESQHSLDEVRAAIERADAGRCRDLVSTVSRGQQQVAVERDGYQVSELDEIDLDTLIGATVYEMNDENIGEISDLILSPSGRIDEVVVEMGGFLGIGEKPVSVRFDQLMFLREEDGDDLRAYIASSQEQLEAAPPYEREASEPPSPDLAGVQASRAFVALDDSFRTDFAGFGIVAFRRSPVGSLSDRASYLCQGFLIGIKPVSVLVEAGTTLNQQVVTAWPVESADQASEMNEAATSPIESDQTCNDAVERYEWAEGDNAINEAVDFFRARGKDEIAARLASPDQDGPWLLAWAPGAEKGSTDDDVLVLAFDLSYVNTQAEAERAFQAWRVAIEQNQELWSAATIANQAWNSAIIRWANMIGRDLDFYNLMRQ